MLITKRVPAGGGTPDRGQSNNPKPKYIISRVRVQEIINSPAYKADQEYGAYQGQKQARMARKRQRHG